MEAGENVLVRRGLPDIFTVPELIQIKLPAAAKIGVFNDDFRELDADCEMPDKGLTIVFKDKLQAVFCTGSIFRYCEDEAKRGLVQAVHDIAYFIILHRLGFEVFALVITVVPRHMSRCTLRDNYGIDVFFVGAA